jgi:hypothetical protein
MEEGVETRNSVEIIILATIADGGPCLHGMRKAPKRRRDLMDNN